MTLPASGAIDAAAINVELGRASTAAFDINGSAERSLAGIPSGAISFSSFYGKSLSSTLDTQTVTTGGSGLPGFAFRGYSGAIGSIADGTSNIYSGAAIQEIQWDEASATVTLSVAGTVANSGWTTMSVAGELFTRSLAAFSTFSGSFTYWEWARTYTVSTQPFGAAGATRTVTWQ